MCGPHVFFVPNGVGEKLRNLSGKNAGADCGL
jgi:hypothetical protein